MRGSGGSPYGHFRAALDYDDTRKEAGSSFNGYEGLRKKWKRYFGR